MPAKPRSNVSISAGYAYSPGFRGRLQCRLSPRMSLIEVRGWCSRLQRPGPAESRERMQFQQGPNQSKSSEGPPVCSGLVVGVGICDMAPHFHLSSGWARCDPSSL